MVIIIGMFFIGIIVLATLTLLVGALMEGNFYVGVLLVMIYPSVIGIYQVGKYLSDSLNLM